MPARAAEPKDKAKVESAVGIVERQILAPMRHMTLTSIGEINAEIAKRLKQINNQPFQKMKTSRQALFETIDKPALKPLPTTRYQHAEWKFAKVHVDYHVAFDDHFYSVPYKHIRQQIELRITAKTIECFYKNERIALHNRSYNRYKFTTFAEHMPKAHLEQAKFSLSHIKQWAQKSGNHTADFIQYMMDSRPFPQQAYRACYGLLRLGDRYGQDRLEKACAKGLALGVSRFQQIELILKNNLEGVAVSELITNPLPDHDNIRGPDYYQ